MLFYLPSRIYYPQLSGMSDDSFQATIWNVVFYAAMEFLSFVALYVVLKRKLRISAIHQLAFVLEKQWTMVQVKLVLWVVFMLESTLEHLGTVESQRGNVEYVPLIHWECSSSYVECLGADYSFKFRWLHSSTSSSAVGS